MFRRQADDLTVGVLEAGSVALATVFVALEIRQGMGPPAGLHAPEFGFPEAALDVASLAVLAVATMRIAERLRRPVLHWGWRIQGALALAGGVLLILDNPLFTDVEVGNLPLLDWLLPAYLVPALLAVVARRSPATEQPARPAAAAGRLCAGRRVCLDHAGGAAPVPSRLHRVGCRERGGCRTVGVVGRLARLWRRGDGGRHRGGHQAAAAGGAGDRRPDHREGVPGRHVGPGRPVAGAVVPRVSDWC